MCALFISEVPNSCFNGIKKLIQRVKLDGVHCSVVATTCNLLIMNWFSENYIGVFSLGQITFECGLFLKHVSIKWQNVERSENLMTF